MAEWTHSALRSRMSPMTFFRSLLAGDSGCEHRRYAGSYLALFKLIWKPTTVAAYTGVIFIVRWTSTIFWRCPERRWHWP